MPASNLLILAPENAFSEIIDFFLSIFGTKFVIICAAKSLKIGYQIKLMCKAIFNRNFLWKNNKKGKSLFSQKILSLNILSKLLKINIMS